MDRGPKEQEFSTFYHQENKTPSNTIEKKGNESCMSENVFQMKN